MPRHSLGNLSQQVIERAAADPSSRRIQLRVDFVMSKDSATPGQHLGCCGGEWDLDLRRFVGPGTKARIWYVEELQRDAVVYWLAWLTAYLTKDWATFNRTHGRRPYSLWTVGGRRRGKTWTGSRFLAAFAIANPETFPPWFVSPIEDDFQEGKELHTEWVKGLPPSWYEWNYREMYIQIVNGARIMMYSAHDAEKLKNGAMGYVFWNEVQKSRAKRRGLNNLRGGAADVGTLVHCAANPARSADEYWIEEVFEGLERGDVEGKLLDFRGDNPNVDEHALDSMASEMSERDYDIERGGARLPRTDIVLHAFRDGKDGNVRPVPEMGEITGAFLKAKMGRPFAALVGADFQKNPHEAATVDRFFLDPLDPNDALSWTVDEAIVDQGDENDLIDELERLGLRGSDALLCLRCGVERPGLIGAVCPQCKASWADGANVRQLLATAVVTDATGKYQRANREYNKIHGYGEEHGSWAMFRKRGWRHLFKPDATQERNPHVDERVLVSNARLGTKDRVRHAFIAPHCTQTIRALKKWPNGKFGPSRESEYAHICDAWTYKNFRLWPRRPAAAGSKVEIEMLNVHGREDRAW